MAEFFKKFLTLSESASFYNKHRVKIKGGVKFIKTDNRTDVSIVLNSFPFHLTNDARVIVFCGKNFHSQKLSNTLYFTITLDGFTDLNESVLVIADGDLPVAYAPSDAPPNVVSDIIKNAPNGEEYIEDYIKEDFDCKSLEYDDELIATENYYEFNEHDLYDENADVKTGDCYEKKAETDGEKPCDNETDFSEIEEHYVFSSASGKIDELLGTYPKEKSLTAMLPSSDFVLISYDGNKSYAVGKTVIDGITYYCYGVKGIYGENCLENSRFVPLSPINTESEGYYLVFQDAKTGKTVKITR